MVPRPPSSLRPGSLDNTHAEPASVRTDHHRPLPAATISSTTSRMSEPITHAMRRRQRNFAGKGGAASAGEGVSSMLISPASEGHAHAHVHTRLVHLLP